MTIITNKCDNDHAIFQCCAKFIKRFGINRLLRVVNASKEKGISANVLFAYLLGLVFTGKNHYTLLETLQVNVGFAKDAVYRFLNKATINWENFILRLSSAVIPEVRKLTSEERKAALVIDDSPYYRNRSKKVEMLSRCYDHVKNTYYKGLTLLTLGWTDGQTFIPVNYRLLGSSNDKSLLVKSQVREDKRTIATKRRIDARKEKPALVLEMLKAVKGTAAEAKYVLFDSWFAFPAIILSIKGLGFHVVARLKNNENFRYAFNGENLSISQIYRANNKRRGKSRYLLSVIVYVRHNDFSEPVQAKLVYVRSKGNRKKWIALISTDMSLAEDEIVALYGKRWDIETFHKMIKSYLRLAKEFQVRSFDGMTAHTAVVLTRYTLLSLENRENKDDRTLGELFYIYCKELEDISFGYAFSLIISVIEQCLNEYLCLTKSLVNAFVENFLACLPAFIKEKLGLLVCES